MFANNFLVYSLKILLEMIKDVFFFPLWWYSRGLLNIFEKMIIFVSDQEKSVGLSVWIKNIFKPMYAQYDWQGRIISFFMRLVQIVIRAIYVFVTILLAFFVICFWTLLPIFVLYEIFFQLSA